MIKLSQSLIKNFVKFTNQTPFENAYERVGTIINSAMNTIMSRNPFINKYKLVIANEALSGSAVSGSTLDIFLILDAPQIELNFIQKQGGRLKLGITNFLKAFKDNFKLIKRKKHNKKRLQKEESKLIKTENYNIANFYRDLQIQLCKELCETTTVFHATNHLKVMGKEEFGVEVSIFPVFISSQNEIGIYNIRNKKRQVVNFRYRYENLDKKNSKTKNIYKLIIRIFNNLYYNVYKYVPNQIFVESLIYNVPNEYFSSDIYNTMIKIVNFLKNSAMQNFVSICDDSISIYKEPLNTVSFEMTYRFIKSIQFE